jgi:uncharacterized protein (UPF0264 family)
MSSASELECQIDSEPNLEIEFPISQSSTTKLLISVRDAAEANLVNNYQEVAILDVKEPANGSLGLVAPEIAEEISGCDWERTSQTSLQTSIALGEVVDGQFWPDVSEKDIRTKLNSFDFVKCGLAGMRNEPDWREHWQAFLEPVPQSVTRVAVAYVDDEIANSPPMTQVLESARQLNCGLLLDTFGKSKGGLFDWCVADELQRIIEQAKDHDLKVVLAGSLRADSSTIDQNSIAKAIRLQPDYVAVRGAACDTHRASAITEKSLATFIREFNRCDQTTAH